ncbi:prothoracicostatic peptides-like [Liolophura sinensis]|uniref:prothoracicostatic peptides-like n=1 Tax=Liolophura sinensis TaxID=3198878 RepID=UPI0031597DF5
MRGPQDLVMYAALLTLCGLCLLLSDRTVYCKAVSDESIDRDALDIKNLDGLEKPSSAKIEEKRKWADYATWGKRKWEGVPTWGKRWSEGLTTWGKRADDHNQAKRQWNQFVTWGKRSSADDKRKDWSSFSTWGKRGKWSGFNTWGKRDVNTDALENAITERVINRFDDDGDHGLNRDEMLAFVNWLRVTGGESPSLDGFNN